MPETCKVIKSTPHFKKCGLTHPEWDTRYFKPSEIVTHNHPDDCWVSLLGIVKDLTPLIEEFRDTALIQPILAEAGKDISHWFTSSGELQTFIHPINGALKPLLPHGFIPHVSEYGDPSVDWVPPPYIPWWKDEAFNVGRVTSNVRPVRIFNMRTNRGIMLNVCEEDSIEKIKERYSVYNSNADSYTWKFEGKKVCMDKTLSENNILDLRPRFRLVGLADNMYIPCLMLYYNDDFSSSF